MVLLVLASASACDPRASVGTQVPEPTVLAPLELRAEPLDTRGVVQVQRYRVAGLPARHGYEPGRLVGLFARVKGLPEAQVVGAAEVVEAQVHSLELVAVWVDPVHTGVVLQVGEVPTGHHLGSKLGQVLEGERDPRQVRINMGAAHGVMVGDVYAVLGDAYTDANAGGRSLGRRQVGEVQVVEADRGGQTAVVELRQGEALGGAFVRYAGHTAVQPRPVVKVLLTRFQGDVGDAYGQGLRDALERTVKTHGTPDIRIETTDKVIDMVDAGDAQATRLGRDFKVDVVVWGSANQAGKNLVVRPRVTFLDARRHGERLWDPVKMDAERSRAVTMGQIADIHHDRGEMDEALRIRKQEQLPVFDKLGDIRERAVTMGKIADIHYLRGEMDEALRIYKHDVLPVFTKLGAKPDVLITHVSIAFMLLTRNKPGDPKEAGVLLRAALISARAMKHPAMSAIEGLLKKYGLAEAAQ